MDVGLKGVVGKEWPEEYKVAGKVDALGCKVICIKKIYFISSSRSPTVSFCGKKKLDRK